MEQIICGVHNTPMVFKPAGIIKTGARAGQPYEAFWSCPVKAPDGSYCKFKPNVAPTPTHTFTASLEKDNRDDNIRWCNALNNATMLIAHGIIDKEELPSMAIKIFNLKPKQ